MGVSVQVKSGDWHSVELAIRQISQQLGPKSAAQFAELVLANLTANRLIASDADNKLVSTDIANWVLAGTGVTITDNLDGTVSISSNFGIEEVADQAERLASSARVVYQQDIKKLYLRRG